MKSKFRRAAGGFVPRLSEFEDRAVPAAAVSGATAHTAFDQALSDQTAAQSQFTAYVAARPASAESDQDRATLVGTQTTLVAAMAAEAGRPADADPTPDQTASLTGVQTQFANLLARLVAQNPTETGPLATEFGELTDAETQLSTVLTAAEQQGQGGAAQYQQNLADLTTDQGILVGLLGKFSGNASGSTSGSGSGSTSGSGSSSTSNNGSGSGSMSGSGSGTGSTSSSGSVAPAQNHVVLDAISAAAPGGPRVIVYNADGSVRFDFYAYEPTFTGGVRVATGDVTGDGTDDIITVSGPGRETEVWVFDGTTGLQIRSATPFEASFTGGGYVAAGDLDGTGAADILVAAAETGGPRVIALPANGGPPVASFFGIDQPDFRGGARVAVEDLSGDGTADVVVTAGESGGPRVAVYDGRSVTTGVPVRLTNDFFAMDASLRGGASVAGVEDAAGHPHLAFGDGPGGQPHVVVLDAAVLLADGAATALARPTADFTPDTDGVKSSARVGSVDPPGEGLALAVSFGVGVPPTPLVYAASALAASPSAPTADGSDFFPAPDASFIGGVYVS